MGAAESRLAFRNNVIKLAEPLPADAAPLNADDAAFWSSFVELPTSTDEVFALCSAKDVRNVRTHAPQNLEHWVRTVATRLLSETDVAAPLDDAATRRTLNCVRLLTRLLPVVLDARAPDEPSERARTLEERVFWAPPESGQAAPLGAQLAERTVALLFWQGLSLPPVSSGGPGAAEGAPTSRTVYYAIWREGIGASAAPAASRAHVQARVEILRLLLAMLSRSMYVRPDELLAAANPWALALEQLEKRKVLTLLCSLMNTVVSWDPVGLALVPYNHVLFGDASEALVCVAVQVLDALLDYGPAPPDAGAAPSDGGRDDVTVFRHYVSKLHRTADFDFLLENLVRLLANPLRAESTYLPHSTKRIQIYGELLVLLWKLFECNPAFLSRTVQSPRVLELTAALMYFSLCARRDPTHIGLLRLACLLLHQLSAEREFCVQLNAPFDMGTYRFPSRAPAGFRAQLDGQQGLGLPAGWRSGTFGDFVVLCINAIVTAPLPRRDSGAPSSPYVTLHETLLIVFSNVSPYLQHLGVVPCQKLLHLFRSVSNPVYFFGREENHRLVFYLLEGINFMIAYQNHTNVNLLYAVLRNGPDFVALRRLSFAQCRDAWAAIVERRRAARGVDSEVTPATLPSASEAPEAPEGPPEAAPEAPGAAEPTPQAPQPRTSSLGALEGVASSLQPAQTQQQPPPDAIAPLSPLKPDHGRPRADSQTSAASETLQPSWTPTEPWFRFWHSRLPLAPTLGFLIAVAPRLAAHLNAAAGLATPPPNVTSAVVAPASPAGQSGASDAEDAREPDDGLPDADVDMLLHIHFPTYSDETTILTFLKTLNYVGLLPPAPPIFVRQFNHTGDGLRVWLSSFLWGTIYLNNAVDPSQAGATVASASGSGGAMSSGGVVPLFAGTRVRLFQIQFKP